MRVPEANALETQPEIDLVHQNSKSSTTKLWRLWPWLLLQPTAVHQVNLLLLLLQEQGDIILASTPIGDEETHHMREIHFVHSHTGKAQAVPFMALLHHLQLQHRQTERNDDY